MSEFSHLKKHIEEFCLGTNLSGTDRHRLTLVAEELFTNTIKHGHGGDCEAPVEISLEAGPSKVSITYIDTAPKYDLLAAAMRTDIESTISQRRIGGLGMALTFALAETAHYTFVDGKNRIIISLARRDD